jgi:hypothetical protein
MTPQDLSPSGSGESIRLSELTDRQAVEDAIAEFDRLGRDGFLYRHGFGEAREYYLVTEDGRYDSKAIFAAAWRNQHDEVLTPADFSGGAQGAAGRLAELGYTIEGIDTGIGRTTYATLNEALSDFQIPLENHAIIRDFVAERDYVSFYIPPSRPYIGMIPRRGGRPDFLHSGYIWYRTPNGRSKGLELPVNKLRDGRSSRQTRREAQTRHCPTCGMALPLSGTCDFC